MKFIDEAIIEVFGGHGGKGCISFRREKYVPRGGPDGGNGGKGGDIVLVADTGMTTLMDLKYRRFFRAPDGRGGKGKDMEGRGGEDIIIKVPLGTFVFNEETDEPLASIETPGQRLVIAKGGRGGLGNAAYANSRRQAPRVSQPGEEGEVRKLRLELKLLADVGLIGEPNAGKSTLLSVLSKARPKIADYPFTTLAPCLGVVQYKDAPSFVMADIPGLVEGAHLGKGMGIQFLKHVERTKVLLHLVSCDPNCQTEPIFRYKEIKKELKAFDASLAKRKELVLLTQIDLIPDEKTLKDIIKTFPKTAKIYPVSAMTRKGVDDMMKNLTRLLA